MKSKFLKMMVVVMSAVFLTCISVSAAEIPYVYQVSGEITWIDLNLGKLQLEADASPKTGVITEYRLTEHETRVTDPADKKLLSVEDLHPGQHVTIDVRNGSEEKIVQKITADPERVSDYQKAYGEVEAIDAAGTLTLTGRSPAGEANGKFPSVFVFDPAKIVVMQSPSAQPVQLIIKPGDVVRIEYVLKDGKRLAKTVTLYSPRVTSTITTTTVTTTK